MARLRTWFLDKIKGIVVTLCAVIIALQIIIPTMFDVLTSAVMVVIVWWCARLHRRKT